MSLDDGEIVKVVEGSYARYANGYMVYTHQDSLFALPFDPEQLRVRGVAVPLLTDLRIHAWSGSSFDVSESGALVYLPSRNEAHRARSLLLIDRDGSVVPLTDATEEYGMPRFSPDGNRIAFCVSKNGWRDIHVLDIASKNPSRLTFNPGWSDCCPAWSPDGKTLAFLSFAPDGGGGIFSQAADGSDRATRVTSTGSLLHLDESQMPGDWGGHQNLRAFEQDFPDNADIYVLSMDGGSEPRPFTETPSVWEFGPRLTADSRWIAYQSDETGPSEIFVQPFPNGEGKWQVSVGGGSHPAWRRDGSELFYLSAEGKLTAVDIRTRPQFPAAKPRLVFEELEIVRASGWRGFANYDVSPDGQSFAIIRNTAKPGREIRFVQNWIEEVKRLVPVGN